MKYIKFYNHLLATKASLKKEVILSSSEILTKLELDFLDTLNCLSDSKRNIPSIKNKCFISLRCKSLFNKRFKLSRIKLKELANSGFLVGVKKHSW
uniref:ribosomal protein S14 n=1 Tax=Cryptomonas gyropyrenoidosa TaxID=233257 RepID=UPI0027A68683|nr:ribosomal protein S14 [Cryptomonas gyropyrenoidosa]WFQ82693.1 ribosomal protein S14 [Cryptomonas gyropyrenoidosa]